MNSVHSFFENQQGGYNDLAYDLALKRLAVRKNDSWKGIEPSDFTSDYNPDPPIFASKFSDCDSNKHVLAIANEDGKIALQDTTQSNPHWTEKALEGRQCHFNAVFDLEWAPGQMKLVSASGDHTSKLFDIGQEEIRHVRTFNGHTRSVKTIAFRKNDPSVFASGGRDGAILVWDVRAHIFNASTSKADNFIISGHVGSPTTPVSTRRRFGTPKHTPNIVSSSVTGLIFQDSNTFISCGAGDGIIKVWDLRRHYSNYKREPLAKHSIPYAGSSTFKGFTNLTVDQGGVTLYVNCMDNSIYSYNLSTYSPKPMQKYVGLRNNTFYIKSCLSPDGKYLISGSSDEKAYIWNLKNSEPLVTLNGHAVEVTCVAWGSNNDMPIVTCSDDARHKIWRIGPEVIKDSEKELYSGYSEYCESYHFNLARKIWFKENEGTPRSSKRIVKTNENTPNITEKVSTKRSFANMNGEDYYENGSDNKRTKLVETRGRRLFSPSTSTGCALMQLYIDNLPTNLESIKEGSEIQSNTQNEGNATSVSTENTHCSSSVSSSKPLSPLSERVDTHQFYSPIPSTSSRVFTKSSPPVIFSPTTNLPNYVINGDAPHLALMSPKRPVKDKVDWLTKIRKQKLMSGRRSLTDKINNGGCIATNCSVEEARALNVESCLSSPRLQNLKASECSPRSRFSPRRRISHNSSYNESQSSDNNILPKTPTSSRRNSETSILRFLTISTNQSAQHNRGYQESTTSIENVPEPHQSPVNLHNNRPTTSGTTCND